MPLFSVHMTHSSELQDDLSTSVCPLHSLAWSVTTLPSKSKAKSPPLSVESHALQDWWSLFALVSYNAKVICTSVQKHWYLRTDTLKTQHENSSLIALSQSLKKKKKKKKLINNFSCPTFFVLFSYSGQGKWQRKTKWLTRDVGDWRFKPDRNSRTMRRAWIRRQRFRLDIRMKYEPSVVIASQTTDGRIDWDHRPTAGTTHTDSTRIDYSCPIQTGNGDRHSSSFLVCWTPSHLLVYYTSDTMKMQNKELKKTLATFRSELNWPVMLSRLPNCSM